MPLAKAHHSDIFWYRIILATGVAAIPLFGVIIQHVSPDSIEFMNHRLLIAAVWLFMLLLSFTSNFIKERFITIASWLLFTVNIWVVWIVYVNNFNLNYVIGFLTSFCALNAAFRQPRLYFPFAIAIVALFIFAGNLAPHPAINTSVASFAFIIVGIVFMICVKVIINTEKKLGELNQTLEKKVAERTAEVQNHAKRLILKNKDLEQFAYIASHDLKSPLRNIGSFVQLLQRKMKTAEDDEAKEYMDFVVTNVNKMHAIIDDVLLYSRFGDETIVFKKTNIEALVQEVCASMRQEIQAKNAVIRCQIPSVKIRCNKKQLEQLFQNLIDNSLKYNKAPQPEIEIKMKETSAEYLFSVSDNGIGIAPEHRDRIFKIFQRLHSDKEYSGTGIGLAICKRIIENHQGEIQVASTPGQGATFFFTISKHLEPAKEESKMSAIPA